MGAERAREGRRVVAEGRAVLGLAEPLGVFRDLVRFARRAEVEPRSRDPLAAGFPAQLLPELGASTIERDNLGATFEAAARYLRALAGRRGPAGGARGPALGRRHQPLAGPVRRAGASGRAGGAWC